MRRADLGRRFALATALAFLGCEAAVVGLNGEPEPQPKDAGVAPTPIDAGFRDEPDVDVSCGQARCRPPLGGIPFCEPYGLPTPAPSCLDDACVYECGGLRLCSWWDGAEARCRNCQRPTRSTVCAANACGMRTVETASVEASTCPFWPESNETVEFLGSRVTLAGGDCRYDAYIAAGVFELGTFQVLEDMSIIAHLPGFGGTCSGEWALTGAPRWVVSCPQCQFVLLLGG